MQILAKGYKWSGQVHKVAVVCGACLPALRGDVLLMCVHPFLSMQTSLFPACLSTRDQQPASVSKCPRAGLQGSSALFLTSYRAVIKSSNKLLYRRCTWEQCLTMFHMCKVMCI